MNNHQEEQQDRNRSTNGFRDHERRKTKRRKQACAGYAYIEMVGWIDRRESVRRDDDCFSE